MHGGFIRLAMVRLILLPSRIKKNYVRHIHNLVAEDHSCSCRIAGCWLLLQNEGTVTKIVMNINSTLKPRINYLFIHVKKILFV